MPRKQRFKPTRKPKLTNEGALERSQDQQLNRSSDESSPPNEEPNSERRE